MNTSQIFLRYFKSDPNGNEIESSVRFVSVADLDYSGCPIDDNGDDFDNDGLVYICFDGEYEVINANDLCSWSNPKED